MTNNLCGQTPEQRPQQGAKQSTAPRGVYNPITLGAGAFDPAAVRVYPTPPPPRPVG